MVWIASSLSVGARFGAAAVQNFNVLAERWRGGWLVCLVLAFSTPLAGCADTAPRSRIASPSTAYDAKLGVSASPRIVKPRRRIASKRARPRRSVRKGGGYYKLGKPYKIAGRWYVPKLNPNYNRTGIASWYGDDFHGRKTANGEIYDMNALSAAHPTMPMPSYAYVTNLSNGRTVLVRVNDRGPYAHKRIIDMSRAAARALDYKGKGLARVQVRYAGRAPMSGSDHRERKFLARQSWHKGAARYASAGRAATQRRAAKARMRPPKSGGLPGPGRTVAAATSGAQSASATARVPTWHWRPGRAPARSPAWARQNSGYATQANALGRRPAATTNNARGYGAVYVQAGIFLNRMNAERLRARLANLGSAHVDAVPVRGTTGFRVTVGPVAPANGRWLLAQVAAHGAVAPRLLTQ